MGQAEAALLLQDISSLQHWVVPHQKDTLGSKVGPGEVFSSIEIPN
jgi:hypothetical protein